jgi:hypothetical protein
MDVLTVSVKTAQTFEARTIRGKGVPLSQYFYRLNKDGISHFVVNEHD